MAKGSAAERMHWADTAKAVAVILVVLYHVSRAAMFELAGPGGSLSVLAELSKWLIPVRMPLFFTISGLLAVRAVARPWRINLRPRIGNYLWVFVLWTLMVAVPYAWAYSPLEDPFGYLQRALLWVFNFAGAYWYLPMLAFYFITAKLFRRAGPALLGLAIFGYIMATSGPVPSLTGFWSDAWLTVNRYGTFLVWFVIGYLAGPILNWIANLPVVVGLALLASYYPLMKATYIVGGVNYSLYMSIVGVLGSINVCRFVSRAAPIRRFGRYIAERTLPIYLLHPLLLYPVVATFRRQVVLDSVQVEFFVVGLVAALTAAACLIYAVGRHVPGLFALPARRAEAAPGSENPAGRRW